MTTNGNKSGKIEDRGKEKFVDAVMTRPAMILGYLMLHKEGLGKVHERIKESMYSAALSNGNPSSSKDEFLDSLLRIYAGAMADMMPESERDSLVMAISMMPPAEHGMEVSRHRAVERLIFEGAMLNHEGNPGIRRHGK